MTAPDGTVWTVRRRREPEEGDEELRARLGRGGLGWAVWAVAAAGLAAAAVWSPWAIAAIAAALALLELVEEIRLRGRPWLVEATAAGPDPEVVLRARGRRQSRRAAGELARALERGEDVSGAHMSGV